METAKEIKKRELFMAKCEQWKAQKEKELEAKLLILAKNKPKGTKYTNNKWIDR